MWKSSPELSEQLARTGRPEAVRPLYCLHHFWRGAVYRPGYQASEDWKSILSLSEYGHAVLDSLRVDLGPIPEPDILLALFARFYHHDLLFDCEKTDALAVRQILQRELIQERIRLPFRWGRLLYDRFNDTYADSRTDHLLTPDIESLLEGAPVGVYQLGGLLSGPLGIIDSKETRYIPPATILPLWHCSDTGCGALHRVRLVQQGVPAADAFAQIDSRLQAAVGPPSEWEDALFWHVHGPTCRTYVDLMALVADCITGRDRDSLLRRALASEHKVVLRNVLGQPPRQKSASEGPVDSIVRRLSDAEKLQLLMALSDQDLIDLIDEAVFRKEIAVPAGEIREVEYRTPRHASDSGCQLSALGIRSVREEPLVNLTHAVQRAYQNLGLDGELSWRVRGDAAKSAHEALVSFVRTKGPGQAVRELVLSSAQVTKAVCEAFRFPLRHARGADDLTVDRILWKLGFSPMQFEDPTTRFKARLVELKEVVLAATPIESEEARERIRAAGVNVFVSLEEFLDRLISYNVWLLSSDHFLGTDQEYSPLAARGRVAETLGGSVKSGDTEFAWDSSGANALGTQLCFLREAAEWVLSLPNRGRDDLRRRADDLPHFADREPLVFPFRHTALWADSDLVGLRYYTGLFGRVVKLVEEADPAAVRNGLDHFRDAGSFPEADKLLACIARLEQAVELADLNRLTPKVFWLYGEKGDRFGSVEYEFHDSCGRRLYLYGPRLVSGVHDPGFGAGYVIAPGDLLAVPNSSLVFRLREESEFSIFWKGYPRRRRIPKVSNGRAQPERVPEPDEVPDTRERQSPTVSDPDRSPTDGAQNAPIGHA
jgi:hypothetical protein